MNRDQVLEQAHAVGLVVKPCHHPDCIAVRAGKTPKNSNERMRMTADGALLTVDNGYYWQVGNVKDVANYVNTLLKAREA